MTENRHYFGLYKFGGMIAFLVYFSFTFIYNEAYGLLILYSPFYVVYFTSNTIRKVMEENEKFKWYLMISSFFIVLCGFFNNYLSLAVSFICYLLLSKCVVSFYKEIDNKK